jgi:selenocysteine lyase/cysteine desulfurase
LSSAPDVEAIRAQIPATGKYVYLNSGWQGPSPVSVIRAVQEAFQDEAEGPTAPPTHERRLATFRRSRSALAALIGASSDEISIQQTTTEGVNIVLFGIGLQPGDEIITCSGEHSSVIVPAYHARDRYGASLKIVRVSREDSPSDILARFEKAATPALRLILLSHISYSSGQLFPVQDIAALAHRRGAYLLLDAAQSIGQIPVNVRELDCDFCAFPGHKWLLGPAATGALYVRKELIAAVNPPRVSHHASAFYNFKDRFEPKVDAIDKFELTTVSVPLLAGLNAAIDFIESVGLDSIRERALALARYATVQLRAVDGVEMVSVPGPSAVRSGIVSFALPGVPPATLTAYLWESRRIVARTVPDAACSRFCVHAFNTEAEVDAAVEVIAEAAKHGVPERDHPSIQTEWDAMVEL